MPASSHRRSTSPACAQHNQRVNTGGGTARGVILMGCSSLDPSWSIKHRGDYGEVT